MLSHYIFLVQCLALGRFIISPSTLICSCLSNCIFIPKPLFWLYKQLTIFLWTTYLFDFLNNFPLLYPLFLNLSLQFHQLLSLSLNLLFLLFIHSVYFRFLLFFFLNNLFQILYLFVFLFHHLYCLCSNFLFVYYYLLLVELFLFFKFCSKSSLFGC